MKHNKIIFSLEGIRMSRKKKKRVKKFLMKWMLDNEDWNLFLD